LVPTFAKPAKVGQPPSQGADADAARVRALAAYKDFLTVWKDADPDIPILKQAKAEYAKLTPHTQADESLSVATAPASQPAHIP
jgi:hypothetical protein